MRRCLLQFLLRNLLAARKNVELSLLLVIESICSRRVVLVEKVNLTY